MVSQLHHRGPDGEGYYCEGSVGLGHARLSILDLAGGRQPIHNEDKTVWVVFNGEIFNYIELRKELENQGHRFYTATDTEVIVHLYEQYGEGFAERLNGQFAIVLWDERNQRLLLLRDRVGITPLFYTEMSGQLLVASEVKALLAVAPTAPELDVVALDQLMTFWSPVSPRTLFKGVSELSPGMMMVIDAGGRRLRRYWDWSFPPGEYWQGSEAGAAEQLLELLDDATAIRLRSDVPVGAYLSGGLDSSVLVALIHRRKKNHLRTFSIGFDDPGLDESAYQQLMADYIGADHRRVHCRHGDIAAEFIDTIWHAESAVLRTAPTPMRRLSRLVREQGFKVVLTGEGSDEVLGGYDIFKEAKVRRFWARQPQSTWRPLLLQRLYPYMDFTSPSAQSYLERFFGMGLENPEQVFFSHLPRWETTAKAKAFFSRELQDKLTGDALDAMAASLPEAIGSWHGFNRAQYLEAKSLMGGYLLCSQGDRMLMANSVEGRFPFLDHRVIEFANRLPPRMKMKVLNEKYLLKRATWSLLPEAVLRRHKQPYRAPDAAAFFAGDNTADTGYVDALLSEETIRRYGYFDAKKVSMLLQKARRGAVTSTRDNQAFIGVLSTQVWHHLFVENFHRNFRQGHG